MKKKTTETHISTINLQHLIIGFGMSIKIPYWTLVKQLAYGRNFRKWSTDKCTFLAPFHSLSDNFDTDSHNFDFDILMKKATVKESLQKNLEHWHHIGPNPSVIDSIENAYFHFNNFVLWNNQSTLQNEYFATHTIITKNT